MVRKLFAVLFIAMASSGFAESEASKIQSTIDQTVWKTFQAAFEALDGEALNSVYADEVLRVTPEGLDVTQRFKKTNQTRFLENRQKGEGVALDFWFDTRHTNAGVSYDTGFYRVTVTSPNGEQSYAYGQFHIVLKNIEGQWKIVQDWDTAKIGGQPITEDDFNRRQPVRF
ncbi:MAG: nuclear transport factor 2 family protein [Pseudomonadaceae bacterium]|nr:nuclear transport factor 2 family protein [Pseudomonadaceae bacterium]